MRRWEPLRTGFGDIRSNNGRIVVKPEKSPLAAECSLLSGRLVFGMLMASCGGHLRWRLSPNINLASKAGWTFVHEHSFCTRHPTLNTAAGSWRRIGFPNQCTALSITQSVATELV